MMGEEKKVFEKALNRFGIRAQIEMVVEEMSKLQKELCESLYGRDVVMNIAEGIADVEIMLDQMKLHFGLEDHVTNNRKVKVSRLAERLEQEENK